MIRAWRFLLVLPLLACRGPSAPEGDRDTIMTQGGGVSGFEHDTPPTGNFLIRLNGRFADQAPFAVAVAPSGEIWTLDAMRWVIDERGATVRWLPAPRRWRSQPYALTAGEIDRLRMALWTSGVMDSGPGLEPRAGPVREGIRIDWHLSFGGSAVNLQGQWLPADPVPSIEGFYREVRALLVEAEDRWRREQGF